MKLSAIWDNVKRWVRRRAPILYESLFAFVCTNHYNRVIKIPIYIIKAKRVAKKFNLINKKQSSNNKLISVITGYTETMKDMAAITNRYLIRYCEFNGYDHTVYLENDFNHDIMPLWSKLIFIKRELEKGYQYVLWADTDAIITNIDYKLENVIENDKHIYIAKDGYGLNCGVIMLKNTDNMISMLDAWFKMYDRFHKHMWGDQAAFMELYDKNEYGIRDLTKIIPQSEWNAYLYSICYRKYFKNGYPIGEWSQNSFTLHFPNMTLNERLAMLKYFK